jgi:hypothetical protein
MGIIQIFNQQGVMVHQVDALGKGFDEVKISVVR